MKMRLRRISVIISAAVGVIIWLVVNPASYEKIFSAIENTGAEVGIVEGSEEGGSGEDRNSEGEARGLGGDNVGSEKVTESSEEGDFLSPLATEILERLEVKGRAPKTGYSREEFYKSWPTVEGCNLRQKIIRREFGKTAVLSGCDVLAGEYNEPYTGEHKVFKEKAEISKGIQIDHVVALSDAWQKGAQYMEASVRYEMATDPLNLLAVDSAANQKKSDGDAATWLPPNKKFRCQYVARQVSVKYKYDLWVTEAEKEAISNVLTSCPNERAVGIGVR